MTAPPDTTAEHLLLARRERRSVSALPVSLRPPDVAAGIAAQHAVARRLGAIPPGGFKIAATAPVMQRYLGLSQPLAAFMVAADIHAAPAHLPWAAFHRLGVECEIGVRLARDLPPGCSPEQAAAAVGDLFAAIELVENRYGDDPLRDLAALGIPMLVADQDFHAAAVTGDGDPDWRARDLAAVQGSISVDGAPRGSGRGDALLGGPMLALAWLAGSAEVAAFGGLRAGQVAMLGSVTPPIWLDGPCTVTVTFDGMPPAVFVLHA